MVVAYLAVAGWVHFNTTPPIYDDSQLRRTLKLVVIFPIIIMLFVVFIITIAVIEYWKSLRGRIRSVKANAHDAAQLEGNFR